MKDQEVMDQFRDDLVNQLDKFRDKVGMFPEASPPEFVVLDEVSGKRIRAFTGLSVELPWEEGLKVSPGALEDELVKFKMKLVALVLGVRTRTGYYPTFSYRWEWVHQLSAIHGPVLVGVETRLDVEV